MNAAKMNSVEEYEIGSEDRVFFSDGDNHGNVFPPEKIGWYYQLRGTAEVYGPYQSRVQAEDAYSEI